MIKIRYDAVDGFKATRQFKTIEGARRYAHERVGEHPEISSRYAVSQDGVGTIYVSGATLEDLFPAGLS